MRTFPVMLDIRGRRAVVVGGGAVGLRKARALLAAGADVTLIAAETTARTARGLTVLRGPYRAGRLAGAKLVFACTDDRDLNSQVARDARRQGALVNVADCPEECDFHMPAVAADGDVVVAVGTGGAAPAAAAWLRRRIAAAMPRRIGAYVAAVEKARASLRSRIPRPEARMRVLRRLIGDRTYRAFLNEGPGAVRAALRRLVGDGEERSCRRRGT